MESKPVKLSKEDCTKLILDYVNLNKQINLLDGQKKELYRELVALDNEGLLNYDEGQARIDVYEERRRTPWKMVAEQHIGADKVKEIMESQTETYKRIRAYIVVDGQVIDDPPAVRRKSPNLQIVR